jgi:adenylate kinase
MTHSKKQVVILFGPPGAGKGTQAGLLADNLGLYYLETSKLLEREFKKPTSKNIEEKKLWLQGKLNSPPFVTELIKKIIKKLADQGENLILAGSPRTVYEAEKVVPFLKKLYKKENIKAFLIDVGSEETIFRNSNRKICELMRHPILYSKETENLENCPLDGSKLIKRKGLDDPETIRVRLEEYKNRTVPVFDIFKKEGIEINKINGERPVVDVFSDILNCLDKNE